VKVKDYLDQLGGATTEAEFASRFPDHVLVAVEGHSGAAEGEEVTVTEKLDEGQIQRQTLTSRDARVFRVKAREGDGPVLVGRSPRCDIAIDHASVSKEHARLTRKKDHIELVDLGSTNGTFHNHRRLEANAPVRLLPDDSVCFGRTSGFQLLDPEGFYHYLKLLQRFAL